MDNGGRKFYLDLVHTIFEKVEVLYLRSSVTIRMWSLLLKS